MAAMSDRWLLWSPRILGTLVSVFLGMFALDAFSPGKPILESVPGFFIHLIPALTVLGVVILSWQREWIGGLACIGLAIAYALSVGARHADWALAISGPLLVVGTLFLWSWQHRRLLPTR
jgi:hypothetical protein